MSPSFSTKNGVRYRFYVSSALLRGRKAEAGSIGRVPAAEIETAVLSALKLHQGPTEPENRQNCIAVLERAVVAPNRLLLTLCGEDAASLVNRASAEIEIAWSPKTRDTATPIDNMDAHERPYNESLVRSIVRSYAWIQSLQAGTFIPSEPSLRRSACIPK